MSILRAGGQLLRASGGIGRVGGGAGGGGGARTVINPATDITYLGLLRLPGDNNAGNANGGVRFGYAQAQSISGRYVNGALHLFLSMSQADNYRGPVCEVVYATPNPVLSSAPRLSIYKTWGQIQNYDIINDYQAGAPGPRGHALHWDEDVQALFYTYDAYYHSEHNCTIGAVTFNGTTSYTRYGPWRTTSPKRQTNGNIVSIPAAYQSALGGAKKLSIGTPNSLNELNTWGHSLYSWDSTGILSVPASSIATESDQAITTTPVMRADYNNKMQRAATYKDCSYNDLANYDCAAGTTLTGLQGVVSQVDMALGAVWINNTTKHGILFLDLMADRSSKADWRTARYAGDEYPHVFYSTYKNCCHGQDKGWNGGTGPHCPTTIPQFWVYDPDVLTNSGLTPYQRANTPAHSHYHLSNYTDTFYEDANFYGMGMWYDQVSRLLFVYDAVYVETGVQFEGIPTIKVFQVAD